ncbi:MAG TPA: hypothetical protein VNX68_18015 [Nitrosopumilaceae archaeon]|jgi:hypothetical protein|nr:hypothetical protein [Nitrosopumilaceae archaeon]
MENSGSTEETKSISVDINNMDEAVKSIVKSGKSKIILVGIAGDANLFTIHRTLELALAKHKIDVVIEDTSESSAERLRVAVGKMREIEPFKITSMRDLDMEMPYDQIILNEKPFYKTHHTKKSKLNFKGYNSKKR